MALLIGMDEAGYGPNYGPLVVGATVWEVPGNPGKIDLWRAFEGIVEQTAPVDDSHIQIADSKLVYNPAKGLVNLELGVLRSLVLHQRCFGSDSRDGTPDLPLEKLPTSFRNLFGHVGVRPVEELDCEPWFVEADLPLPAAQDDALGQRWHERCREHGIRLRCLRADVVLTRRF